jgi:hypothetical protein
MRFPRRLVVSALGLLMSISLFGQSVVSSANAPVVPKEAPDFGTQDLSHVRIGALGFSTLTGAAFGWGGAASRYSTSGPLETIVQVPGGSVIKRLEFDYCDTNPTNHMTMSLYRCDNQGQGCVALLSSLLVSGGDGCTYVFDNTLNETVNNFSYIYGLEVQFGATDASNLLGGAIVSYKQQVSPAPGSATFGDVPTGDPGFQYIEALVSSGITAGCGSGNYCPDATLTRRQMAVFLAKALGLHWVNY